MSYFVCFLYFAIICMCSVPLKINWSLLTKCTWFPRSFYHFSPENWNLEFRIVTKLKIPKSSKGMFYFLLYVRSGSVHSLEQSRKFCLLLSKKFLSVWYSLSRFSWSSSNSNLVPIWEVFTSYMGTMGSILSIWYWRANLSAHILRLYFVLWWHTLKVSK